MTSKLYCVYIVTLSLYYQEKKYRFWPAAAPAHTASRYIRSRRLDFVAGHSDCSTTFIISIMANSIGEDINLGVDIMSLMQLIFHPKISDGNFRFLKSHRTYVRTLHIPIEVNFILDFYSL